MANQDINIKITLLDQVTKNLKTVSSNMRDFSRQMKETGRNLSQVGMYMTTLGAGITAPLMLAYKQASKFNAEIGHQLRETENVFNNLSLSIGKSLLPVMRQLTDTVAKAVDWWNSLEQATRDKIIQNFLKLGIALTSLGLAFVVVGNALKLLANLAVLSSTLLAMNPIVLAVAGSFILLALAMWKCKEVADLVITSIQRLASLSPILNIIRLFKSKTPTEFFGKLGDWATKFNEFKTMFSDFGKTWADFSNAISGEKAKGKAGSFFEGFKSQIDLAGEALKDFQKIGIDVANNMTTAMSGMFTSFFDDAFAGNLKKGKDYFLSFVKSIAKIFTDLMSQMITQWIMVNVMMKGADAIGTWLGIGTKVLSLGAGVAGGGTTTGGGFGVGSIGNYGYKGFFHQGGIIRAHSGLAMDEVPIIAQSGERVLSRSQNREYEKGIGQTINYYIYAMDASSFAQMLYKNKDSVHAIVSSGMKQNTSMRGAIKTYA